MMDGTNLTPSDPAILLLNEIDILLAQTRLMELYLKQAQATGANQAARINQQHQAELGQLRAALIEKEQAAFHQAASAAQQEDFAERIRQLEVLLEAKQSLLNAHEGDLEAARAEILTLQRQVADIETAHQQAQAATLAATTNEESLQSELAALRQQIEQDQQNFRQQHLDAQQLERELRAQLAQLQIELAEKQAWQHNAGDEIKKDLDEIVALRNDILQLQASRQRAEADAAQELEQARAHFNAEIAQLQTAQDSREQEHQQDRAALAAIEASHKAEIDQLRRDLDDKRQQIESHGGAWHEAESEIAGLRQRVGELEAAEQRAASDQAALENARASLENQLGQLHHEVAVKERDLTQRYEAVSGVELALHGRIQGLQQELAQGHQELAHREHELANTRAENAALSERQIALDQARQEAEENWQRSGVIQSELQARLQTKTDELNAARNNVNELTDQSAAKINELQLHLAEKQLLVESRSAEIVYLKEQQNRLLTQVAEAESTHRQSTDLLQESEQSRSAQNEIAALTAAHRTELRRLENELTQERDASNHARGQIQESARRSAELESDLRAFSDKITATNAERDALQARLHDFASQREIEQADEQARAALTTELGALRQELQQKSWAMAQEQATAEELASAHRAQIGELEAKLAELGGGALGDENLRKQHERARKLEQRVEELEIELRHAELTAVSRAEQIRQESAGQIAALNAALKQKSIELDEQGNAQTSKEQSLRHEVERLLRQVEERNQILQNRNDELVRVKADLDSNQDRLNRVDVSVSLAENAASSEMESMRSEFQAQLALLQAELSQKDWALDDRHATVEGLAQEHRQEVESLRRQLNEKSAPSDPSTGAVSIDAANLTAQAHERRWHGGFAAKRRWKV
jgi:chromosome segregation ATPase